MRFVIESDTPLASDRLAHMGHLPVGDGRDVSRWFPRNPAIPHYHARFAA